VTRTVHLVYPHGASISSPDAIGRHLATALQERYDVRLANWDDTHRIVPAPGDVLLGHPHPHPWTVFRRSARLPGWSRVIGLSPYNHGDVRQAAFVDSVIRHCDLYLAITGSYWFESVDSSRFAHWQPKLVHVDLAIDRSEFPPVKDGFNPPGQRRIVYIGHSAWTKNTGFLSEIAAALPDVEFAWIGEGPRPIGGVSGLGRLDFADPSSRAIVAGYDLMLTVGAADSNPATVLEAMAWGLIPVCTPQSGYVGLESVPNVPLGDSAASAEILRSLLGAPEQRLHAWQIENWRLLDGHFNWKRFAAQVVDAIESTARPPLLRQPGHERLALRWAAARSPYSPLRGPGLRHTVRILRGAGS
jgi:glycosyltransferase involved in cell wall biosynthesis